MKKTNEELKQDATKENLTTLSQALKT